MNHLDRALDKQNQWWKYLLVIIIAFFAGQIVGAIPLVALMVFKVAQSGGSFVPPENAMDLAAYGIDQNLGLALMVLPFIVTLFIAIVLIKAFHQRSYKEIINGTRKIRWNRIFTGFMVWALLFVAILLVDILIDPDNFRLQFDPSVFFILVIIALLLIPLQSATEEFLFRGYLAQGVAAWTKNRWIVIIIPSVLFGLMHGANPEVKEFGFWTLMPHYILWGIAFGIICILDDGIELAIGVHAANNALSGILVTHKSSALQTPALFEQMEWNPQKELLVFFIACVVFIVLMKYKYNWQFSVLQKKLERNILEL